MNGGAGRHGCHVAKTVFVHFQETSFIIEEEGETLGFLCGFFHKHIKMKHTFILSV